MFTILNKKQLDYLETCLRLTNAARYATACDALEKFQAHPNLCRRLVGLKKMRVNLSRKTENPLRDEMLSAGITEDHIAIISDYLAFLEHEKAVEMSEYTKTGRGVFCTDKTARLLVPRATCRTF